jgi:3-methyladenine DNA glycosylase/8-oxoguanine DNA glycosylase
MALETTLAPTGPYSLAQSAWRSSDATRFFRDDVLTAVFEADEGPTLARVWQRGDGTLSARLEGKTGPAAVERLRFMLALDDDHSAFRARFRDDPLLGPAIRRLGGMRPLRVATVLHSLLKAVCGQLIQARAARLLENRLVRIASPEHEGLRLPPCRETFRNFSPAELERHGLAARKATTLIRLSRELDLEKLHRVATPVAAGRIERERGLGPWSAGVVCLHGLGRFEHGLVGDLGLIKLCAALRGRRADVDDTRELLAPYGEWAGLASYYLLADVKSFRPARAGGGRESRPESSLVR